MSVRQLMRKSASEAPLLKLRSALHGVAEVRAAQDAEEPILGEMVRKAIVGWLVEINNRDLLETAGIKPRSTALLYGPPGCGKTTLAHHLAARLGIPLVLVGSEGIFAGNLGASERNAARLFDALKEAESPCVVFLDEIDAIGGKRVQESGGGGARSAMNSTLNVILRKIEEYQGILIGATNFADGLDPALWRRFGMQIDVALPGADERFAILRRYGEPFDFDEEIIEALTDWTDGAAPSLLRQLMEGAKRLLVIGPNIGFPTNDAGRLFHAVIKQNAPHPDYKPPMLWAHESLVDELASKPWPPQMLVK